MESHVKVSGNQAEIIVNPKMYTLASVYSAAYVFIDRAYVLLDEDQSGNTKVIMKPKEDADPAELGNDFFNELLAYADYQQRAEESKRVRDILLQRALITNDPGLVQEYVRGEGSGGLSDEEFDKLLNDLEGEVDDSEDIAVPWEEKYGPEEGESANHSSNEDSEAEKRD